MAVKIMVPSWILILIRHPICREPQKSDHNFDNHPFYKERTRSGSRGVIDTAGKGLITPCSPLTFPPPLQWICPCKQPFMLGTLNPKLREGSLPSSDRPRTLAESGRGEVRVKPHPLTLKSRAHPSGNTHRGLAIPDLPQSVAITKGKKYGEPLQPQGRGALPRRWFACLDGAVPQKLSPEASGLGAPELSRTEPPTRG